MIRPNTWGTHLEIIAAATLFKVPVYYCTQSASNSHFTWGAFRPITSKNISFPVMVEDILQSTERIDHIEMYYHQAAHYDAIISTESELCKTPPQLTGKNDPDTINLC